MPVEAPPAPAAPAAPDAPPPEPVLHVDGSGVIDKGPAPSAPKKGSAREAMFAELRKRTQTPTPTPEPTPPAEVKKPPTEAANAPEGSPSPDSTTPHSEPGAAPAGDKKKVSPWKLVEEYKGKVAALEKEVAEVKTTRLDPKEKEQLSGKLTAAEKELQDLREEIRYVNYQKHPEFVEKYQKPYEDAWKRAMGELSELTVADETSGEQRAFGAPDLLALVNLPLQQARAKAVELYGDFADDVMAHRKEVRRLFDEQNAALDKARKSGAEREEQLQRQFKEYHEKTNKQLAEFWSRANEEALTNEKHSQYFKPLEGDEEGNKRLARGYELADKAFTAPNPAHPQLTPEQREEIVRMRAVVRHRAAAYGRTRFWLERAQSEITALKAELAKYKGAEPGAAAGRQAPATPAHASARDSVFGALRKLAH